jgi:hypothetical protein
MKMLSTFLLKKKSKLIFIIKLQVGVFNDPSLAKRDTRKWGDLGFRSLVIICSSF